MREDQAGDVIDQYRLTELLARTAQSSLFAALDTDSGAPVVLKIPLPQYEADVASFARFEREERIGQRIQHPNIVKMLTPRHKSRVYLVMQIAPGRPLRVLLDERGPWPVEEALALTRQVCEAIVHLHAHDIVHRDLKPENLIVDDHGHVRLVDFGIALDRSARRLTWTRLSPTIGTPDYMAPEQIKGRRGDERSDIYALGTLLYELLTGKLPYTAPSVLALLHAKTSADPTPPSHHLPTIEPALEAIILKAIARDPRRRYDSAATMLADLRDPASTVSRVDELEPPRPPSRLMSTMLAALAFAGLCWLVWLSTRH